MTTPLRHGHAAWVWMDIDGTGMRWELIVPTAREYPLDEEDEPDRYLRLTEAVFPLRDDYRIEIDECDDCVQRKVEMPLGPPTGEELAAADGVLDE